MDKYGEFVVDKVFKNKDGETSYTGKFKNNGEKREFILHSKDKIVKEEYEESPEETLEGLKEMAMGNLERIADYANMISQRMGKGQNLESWMYSQLTIALENLNSVHDAMDGVDGIKESVNEGLYFVGYNKGRGQGTGVFKDSYSSYKDAKKAVEKIEKERGGSYNQTAYYVADKDGKFVRESVNEGTNEEWAGLDTIKRGGYGSSRLQNGDKIRMVIDARKNKYYNGVINGSSIKWEDGAKSELSLSTQASNRGDLQVLRPTTKNESVNEATMHHMTREGALDNLREVILNIKPYSREVVKLCEAAIKIIEKFEAR
jgi:hypothetical protein